MVEPNDTSGTSIRLGDFQPTADRGASRPIEAMWYLVKMMFFLTSFRWPSPAKSWLLRVFGAEVGSGVVIAPRVDIHMPWKLQIGDHSWIGTDVMLLNLEPITIGSNTCVSQRAFLCTGGHDYTSPTFDYRGGDIVVGDGVVDRWPVVRRPGGDDRNGHRDCCRLGCACPRCRAVRSAAAIRASRSNPASCATMSVDRIRRLRCALSPRRQPPSTRVRTRG